MSSSSSSNRVNEVVVVKVGGAKLTSDADLEALADHIDQLRAGGADVVVVHGGGPEIAELHEALAIPVTKANGLRITSERSMPVVTMVLCGLVNKRLVARLVARGHHALGLSGVDMGLMRSAFLNRDQLGRVGGPPRVEAGRLEALFAAGIVPVLASVCLGPDDRPLNVNADMVAHAVAVGLRADSLDFVSDVPGVKTDAGIAGSLTADEIQRLVATRVVEGGMIPKLQAAVAAIDSGVGRVRVGDLTTLCDGTSTEVRSRAAAEAAKA